MNVTTATVPNPIANQRTNVVLHWNRPSEPAESRRESHRAEDSIFFVMALMGDVHSTGADAGLIYKEDEDGSR